jgi:thiamine biosynthesis protein ThiS
MKLSINNEQQEFAEGITVSELLNQLRLTGQFVAVERNLNIVPHKTFQTTILEDGDTIELVTLVGGG